ncbi:MAG: 4Fe-4S dicluster domain-containing protein [Planctomycetota bacterium]
MPTQELETIEKRVFVDMDRCIECGSCAAACYYSHADMPAVQQARAGWALLPVICRQCKSAPCVDVCPAEAMVRDDQGVVRRRLFRCIGCGSCARACPFGVITTTLGGTPVAWKSPDRLSGHQVAKCDLCADRLSEHPDAVPRCVAACPAGALVFADAREAPEEGIKVVGGRTAAEDFYKRR